MITTAVGVHGPGWRGLISHLLSATQTRMVNLDRGTLLTAARVSAVVGTILNLINQGPQFASGAALSWPHVFLNYLVPFCVSAYSGWRAKRQRPQPPPASETAPERHA